MLFFWYNAAHKTRKEAYETTRNTSAARTAPPSGDPTLEAREAVFVFSRSLAGSIQELRVPMASVLSKEGLSGSSAEVHSGTPDETFRYPEKKTGSDSSKGTIGLRLSDRPLDFKAHRRTNKKTVWHTLSSQSRLESLGRDGMELPEAGTPRAPKERRRNRSLEALSVAAYKKRPKSLAPTSYSWMKAAFCLFPILPVRGPQKDKRLSFATSIDKTGFLPSARFRYRLLRGVSPCISVVVRRTLRVWTYAPFLKSLPDILKDRWFCSGIVGLSTGAQKSRNGFLDIQGFIRNSFRLMRLNLTLLSMYGTKRTVLSPTAFRKTCGNLKGYSKDPLPESVAPRSSFGLVSMHPIYHGQDRFVPLLMRNSIALSFQPSADS
jgi:hypothetical protein